jgi:hypothetical protein
LTLYVARDESTIDAKACANCRAIVADHKYIKSELVSSPIISI